MELRIAQSSSLQPFLCSVLMKQPVTLLTPLNISYKSDLMSSYHKILRPFPLFSHFYPFFLLLLFVLSSSNCLLSTRRQKLFVKSSNQSVVCRVLTPPFSKKLCFSCASTINTHTSRREQINVLFLRCLFCSPR